MKQWERDFFIKSSMRNTENLLQSLVSKDNSGLMKKLKEQSQQSYDDAMEWERLKKEHADDNKKQEPQEVKLTLNGKEIKGSVEDAIVEEISKAFK